MRFYSCRSSYDLSLLDLWSSSKFPKKYKVEQTSIYNVKSSKKGKKDYIKNPYLSGLHNSQERKEEGFTFHLQWSVCLNYRNQFINIPEWMSDLSQHFSDARWLCSLGLFLRCTVFEYINSLKLFMQRKEMNILIVKNKSKALTCKFLHCIFGIENDYCYFLMVEGISAFMSENECHSVLCNKKSLHTCSGPHLLVKPGS